MWGGAMEKPSEERWCIGGNLRRVL
jgi:hypothetical protein